MNKLLTDRQILDLLINQGKYNIFDVHNDPIALKRLKVSTSLDIEQRIHKIIENEKYRTDLFHYQKEVCMGGYNKTAYQLNIIKIWSEKIHIQRVRIWNSEISKQFFSLLANTRGWLIQSLTIMGCNIDNSFVKMLEPLFKNIIIQLNFVSESIGNKGLWSIANTYMQDLQKLTFSNTNLTSDGFKLLRRIKGKYFTCFSISTSTKLSVSSLLKQFKYVKEDRVIRARNPCILQINPADPDDPQHFGYFGLIAKSSHYQRDTISFTVVDSAHSQQQWHQRMLNPQRMVQQLKLARMKLKMI